MSLTAVLMIAAPLLVGAGWVLVRAGRLSIWVAMGGANVLPAVPALLTGGVHVADDLGVARAASVGLGAGIALYLATAAFMAVAVRWPPLARHTEGLYDQQGDLPLPAAAAVGALLVGPAEEIVWRGLIQTALATTLTPLGAALVTWAGYTAANAVSLSIPIILGAVVGGGVWGTLALWSGGVVAPICCHAVWTALMILRPPVPSRP